MNKNKKEKMHNNEKVRLGKRNLLKFLFVFSWVFIVALVVLAVSITANNIVIDNGKLSLYDILFVNNNGNVGIGTTSPNARLEVNGSITAADFNGKNLSGAGIGMQIITGSPVQCQNNAWTTATANCPVGWILSGGGCDNQCLGGTVDRSWVPIDSYTFRCSFWTIGAQGSRTLTAKAICIKII